MRNADSLPSASPSPSDARRSEALTVGDSDLSRSTNAGKRTSRTRVVLPEPLTPVTHTNRPQRNLDAEVLEIIPGGVGELESGVGVLRVPQGERGVV